MEANRKLEILLLAQDEFKQCVKRYRRSENPDYQLCGVFHELLNMSKINSDEYDYFIDIIHSEMRARGTVWSYAIEIPVYAKPIDTVWAWDRRLSAPRTRWFTRQIKLARNE